MNQPVARTIYECKPLKGSEANEREEEGGETKKDKKRRQRERERERKKRRNANVNANESESFGESQPYFRVTVALPSGLGWIVCVPLGAFYRHTCIYTHLYIYI